MRYVISRIGQAAAVLLIVSVVMFALVRMAPGGPEMILYPNLTLEQAQAMRAELGLSQPLPGQYVEWLGNVVVGDLGTSYTRALPVTELLAERLLATFVLLGTAIAIAIAVGVTLGAVAAVRRGSHIDRFASGLSAVGMAMPAFWLGIVLITVFSVQLGWLPTGGLPDSAAPGEYAEHLLMPAVVLATLSLAKFIRYTRASVLEQLDGDYVVTARAKGLPERTILVRHVLRNALVPVVTVIGLEFRTLISGAAITETVFAWPGMGRLAYEATFERDYPVMMGVALVATILVVVLNLLVDLVYSRLDPRIELA